VACGLAVHAGETGTPTPGAPQITRQPLSQTLVYGSPLTLSVTATGELPLSYQWQKNGTPIDGATGSQLTFTNVSAAIWGDYVVTVTNSFGSVTSDIATLILPVPPQITQQPYNHVETVSATAVLYVLATGTPPLFYQWYQGTNQLAGATNQELDLIYVTSADGGVYTVVVTNQAGSLTSRPASLRVNPDSLRQLRLMGLSAGTNGQVVAPVQVAAVGGEHSLSFSLQYDPNVITNPVATLTLDAANTNWVTGSSGDTNAPLSATLVTDTSALASGAVGVSVSLPTNATFKAGVVPIVSVAFDVIAGQDAALAALLLGDLPTAIAALDTTTNGPLPLQVFVLPTLAPSPAATNASLQSGLFSQKVRVTNPAGTLADLRLLVRGLTNDSLGIAMLVYNAAGFTNGIPYVQFGPMTPGSSVDLTLNYYVADRVTVPNVTYEAQLLPFTAVTIPTNNPINLDRALFTNGVFAVEFNTLLNASYYIQYQDILGGTDWQSVVPGVAGTGSRVQWIDDGPPKTLSVPSSQTNRFYRVFRYP